MSKKTMTKLRVAIYGLAVFLFMLPFMAGAAPWTDPTCAPPNCNTEGPVWINPSTAQTGYIELISDETNDTTTLKIDPEGTSTSFNDLTVDADSSSSQSGFSLIDNRTSIGDAATLEVQSAVDNKPAIYGYSSGTGTAYGGYFYAANNAGINVRGGIKFVGLTDLNEPSYFADGLLYYNTSSHVFKYYDSAAGDWKQMSSPWSVSGNEVYYSLAAGDTRGVAIKSGDTSGPNDDYTLDVVRKAQTTSDRGLNVYFENIADADYVSGSLGGFEGANMYGVRGKADLTGGFGVYGTASNGFAGVYGLSGNNGGYFSSTGNLGVGVYGTAVATGAVTNYGGHFRADGNSGRGVYGNATATGAVTNYGVYGSAGGSSGYGVYGVSTAGVGVGASSPTTALSARTTAINSTGGYFYVPYSDSTGIYADVGALGGSSYSYGGYFRVWGDQGSDAVFGFNRTTGAVTTYGGRFRADSDTAHAVHGEATATGAVANFGGYFTTAGNSGAGVYAAGPGTPTSTAFALKLENGAISMEELATLPTNTANYGTVYIKSSDSKLYFQDDSGVEYDLTGGGGSGTIADGTADGQLTYWDNTGGTWTNSSTSDLFWDATTDRLGINESNPQGALHVSSGYLAVGNDVTGRFYAAGDGDVYIEQTLEADGNAYVGQNLSVGVASGTGNDYIYMDGNSENIMWDDTDSRFEVSDDFQASGYLQATVGVQAPAYYDSADSAYYIDPNSGNSGRLAGDLSIGYLNSATADDYLYFNYGAESLMWSDSNSTFTVSDDLTVNNNLVVLDNLIMQEGAAPSNTAGYGKFYVSSTDSLPHFIDDGGTEYDLIGGGSGSIDDGTYDGQLAFWDDAGGTWTYADASEMVWDDTNKNLGIGVVTPTSTHRFSVYNSTSLLNSTAIYGSASSTTTMNYGGSFLASGTNGSVAVRGDANGTGSYTNYGGSFTARGTTGVGVYGYANSTGGGINYGGQFMAAANSGIGVYGSATATGAVSNVGGRFSAAGDSGVGVYASGPSTPTTTALALKLDNGAIAMEELATTPTNVSNYGTVYVKSSDSKLYFQDDGGTEYDLTSGGDSNWDADADTGIQVEEGADDDTFRVDAGGVGDRVLVDSSTVILGTLFGNAYIGLDNSSSGASVVASTGKVQLGDPEGLGNSTALEIDDTNSKIWTNDAFAIGTSTLASSSTLTIDNTISAVGTDAIAVNANASNSAAGGNVYGVEATATGNGSVYGGSFTASGGAVGTGVYGSGATYGGNFNSTSGYGVQATSTASAGRGVFGQATYTAVDSVTYGGYFTSSNDSGVGIYGEGSAVGGDGVAYNYGGYFVANGPQGIGAYAEVDGYGDPAAVKGLASNTTSTTTNYGGHFTAAGGSGMGVYGTSTSADVTYDHYGGYFTAPSGNGIGVYGAGNQAAAYFNGNVGINDSAPSYDLDIVGDMIVTESSSDDVYIGDNVSPPTGMSLYLLADGANGLVRSYLDAGSLTLQAGTSSSYANSIVIGGGYTVTGGTDEIQFYNGTSNVASVTYLGMEANAYYGSSGTTYYVDPDNAATSANFAGNIYLGRDSSTDDDFLYFDYASEYLMWDDSETHFNFSDDIYTAYTIRSGSNTYVDDNLYLNYDQSSSYVNILFGTTGSTAAEYIQYNPTGDDFTLSGDVYARTTLLSSDERLKENIVDIDDSSALKIIGNLRPVTFDWKENGDKDYGFIAQEMYEYLPDLVDRPEDDGYWSVEYANITAVLTAAMQEQQKEIEDLEARLEKLEAKLVE